MSLILVELSINVSKTLTDIVLYSFIARSRNRMLA